MIKIIFMLLALFFLLDARENPFFPSKGEKDILITSNENRDKKPLQRAALTLPSQARIIQKVTVEYKNLDGSIENRSIELDNSIDWHLPIFISQSYAQSPKEIKMEAATSKINVNKESTEYKKIASIKYLSLLSLDKSLKLITSDEAIRDFILVNPHRVVIDFKKDTDIKSYIKKVPNNIFKEIRIGNHSGYYRVVIELDGYYRHALKKISNGYLLELI